MKKYSKPSVTLSLHKVCLRPIKDQPLQILSLAEWANLIKLGASLTDGVVLTDLKTSFLKEEVIKIDYPITIQSGIEKDIYGADNAIIPKFKQEAVDLEKMTLTSYAIVNKHDGVLYVATERMSNSSHWTDLYDFLSLGCEESRQQKIDMKFIFCGDDLQEAINRGDVIRGVTYQLPSVIEEGDSIYTSRKKEQYQIDFKKPEEIEKQNIRTQVQSIALEKNINIDTAEIALLVKRFGRKPKKIPLTEKTYYKDITAVCYNQIGRKNEEVVQAQALSLFKEFRIITEEAVEELGV